MTTDTDLDRLDLALLGEMQRDNQRSARAIAERVGSSESVVLRRLKRLRREGVIRADVSLVDPSRVGLPLTVHVLVSLARDDGPSVDAFARRLRRRPEVREAWYVAGEPDFVVRLQLADMQSYEAFSQAAFLDDPSVKAFRTLVSLRQVVEPFGR